MPYQEPPRRREAELLPDPFWAADQAALRGQDSALYWYRWQLGLTLLAALFGVFPAHRVDGVNIVPLLSVASFAGAGGFALALHRLSPQELWYQGRSAAESLKTLTWKYLVQARPFDGPAQSPLADRRFLEALRDVPRSYPGIGTSIGTATGPDGPQITQRMRDERRKPLQQRRQLYLTERVYAQRTWYLSRADECDHKSQVWALWTVLMFVTGIAVAVAEATSYPSAHVLGLFSTGAATVTAWAQLKQFRPLAAAYRLAARELDRISALLARIDLGAKDAEEAWSRLAGEAEDTISREHIIWRARSQHRT
ncbi:DUF4231 domain-containing protein [Streptacidiphilus cavernicola]|uniref:DUF4231 domain-containing protein n=1 Tax=Streptacidiphilus cavernicola TaxID=3342716 RepID=A0ABV6VNI3_9ACTN